MGKRRKGHRKRFTTDFFIFIFFKQIYYYQGYLSHNCLDSLQTDPWASEHLLMRISGIDACCKETAVSCAFKSNQN